MHAAKRITTATFLQALLGDSSHAIKHNSWRSMVNKECQQACIHSTSESQSVARDQRDLNDDLQLALFLRHRCSGI